MPEIRDITYFTNQPDEHRPGKRRDLNKMLVRCPFCGLCHKVYTRSFYGSGKRCRCGAILRGYTATRQ